MSSSLKTSQNPEKTAEEREDDKQMQKQNIVSLQLGDVIRIQSPLNEKLNNHTFIIDYIDPKKIMLINVDELNVEKLFRRIQLTYRFY